MLINFLKLSLSKFTKNLQNKNAVSCKQFFSTLPTDKMRDEVEEENLSVEKRTAFKYRNIRAAMSSPFLVFDSVFITIEFYSFRELRCLRTYLGDLLKNSPRTNPHYSQIKNDFEVIQEIYGEMIRLHEEGWHGTEKTVFRGRKMVYGYSTPSKQGHLYPYHLGLPQIAPISRRYVTAGRYTYYTLDDPYPIILLDFAKKHEIETPTLKRLVEDKEGLYRALMQPTNMSRAEAVDKISRCLSHFPGDRQEEFRDVFMLHTEVLDIRDKLYAEYTETETDLFSYISSRENFLTQSLEEQKISIQLLYCFEKETVVLLKFRDLLEEKGGVPSFIPLFDSSSSEGGSLTGCYVFGINPSEVDVLNTFNMRVAPFSISENKRILELAYMDFAMLLRYENYQDLMEGPFGHEPIDSEIFEPLIKRCGLATFADYVKSKETQAADSGDTWDRSEALPEYLSLVREAFVQISPEELIDFMPSRKKTADKIFYRRFLAAQGLLYAVYIFVTNYGYHFL